MYALYIFECYTVTTKLNDRNVIRNVISQRHRYLKMEATQGQRDADRTQPDTRERYQQLLASLSERMMPENREVSRWVSAASEFAYSGLLRLCAFLGSPPYVSLRHTSSWNWHSLSRVAGTVASFPRIMQSNLSASALCLTAALGASWVCWVWRQGWLWIWWHLTL